VCSVRAFFRFLLDNINAEDVKLLLLKILISSTFSLVEETHGSSGQCVSFSLIDLGGGFTAYAVFSFFYDVQIPYFSFEDGYARRKGLIINTAKSEVVHFESHGCNVPTFSVHMWRVLH